MAYIFCSKEDMDEALISAGFDPIDIQIQTHNVEWADHIIFAIDDDTPREYIERIVTEELTDVANIVFKKDTIEELKPFIRFLMNRARNTMSIEETARLHSLDAWICVKQKMEVKE